MKDVESLEQEKQEEPIFWNQIRFSLEMERLKREIEDGAERILGMIEEEDKLFGGYIKFQRTFTFKLNSLLLSFIELEQTILKSSSNEYYKIFFNDHSPSSQTENKISRQIDSLFTQYFSLIDIFIKGISKMTEEEKIESLGDLYNKARSNPETKTFEILSGFIESKEFLNNLKAYRDYTIHQGNNALERINENLCEKGEYSLNTFYIHRIRRLEGREYLKDKKEHQKVNFLFRMSISNLFYLCLESLIKLGDYYWDNPPHKYL